MLKDYGHDEMSCARVFDWHHHFKERTLSIKSDEHPRKSSIRRKAEMVKKMNRKSIIRELCDKVDISIRVMSSHSYRRFGGEMRCSQICFMDSNAKAGVLDDHSNWFASIYRNWWGLFENQQVTKYEEVLIITKIKKVQQVQCKFSVAHAFSFFFFLKDIIHHECAEKDQIVHHHHQLVPLARISLTVSRYLSLSSIASGRSSGLHPISAQSCCM